MKHIFYFLAFAGILWELHGLLSPIKTRDAIFRIRAKSSDDMTTNERALIFMMFFYFMWTFIGLFTFQWAAFLVLFVLGLIPKKWVALRWADNFVSLLLLIFIVINAYHLHLNPITLIFP